ncbi:MAG: sugar transferase [Clostridiales bacterium]|nr:sugar transferase [Clostridiales bacterium]
MNNTYAPIILFVYKRPEHTAKTLAALGECFGIEESELFVFADGPKNLQDETDVTETRRIVREFDKCKAIHIIESGVNKGLANSVISGVTEVIEQYGRAIVVEDDLVLAPDFLTYMNQALDYYESDQRIWSITGYSFNINFPKDYTSDMYLSYRASSWGWATWKDRWDKVDWDVLDYPEFKTNKKLRNKFNRGGRDLSSMLDAQMQGKIDSWAIRWCYAQSKNNALTVYPRISRIQNIGFDGSGSHCGITSKYNTIISYGTERVIFEPLDLDSRIDKAFRDQFGTAYDYMIIGLKTIIKRLLGI